jgi:DNA ligase-1
MTSTSEHNCNPLYRQNSDNSVQSWKIEVVKVDDNSSIIRKHFGRLNGKIQITEDVISSGKNIGRANSTTPHTQAIAEARSQWEKKLKQGYSMSVATAKVKQVVSQYVAGGVEPMLAHKWRDHSAKIKYPAWTQPKLDGIRCIAVIHQGKCTLWSRTRKQIVSVPHIENQLANQFHDSYRVVLDGELYNHEMKDQFERIVSLVRKEEVRPESVAIQYHVYDMIENGTDSKTALFSERLKWITAQSARFGPSIRLVPTTQVSDVEQVIQAFGQYRQDGYEGAMCRADTVYENGRSYGLQKIKEFDDAEYEIIGVEPGRGRMSECAVFVCRADTGEFKCKMEGSLDSLKSYLSDPTQVIGKQLTVRYQGLTNGGLPRFPVGVAVRNYE